MVNTASQVKKEIQAKRNREHAPLLQRFFKTGKGEYAEGDIFYGLTVPESRIIAKKFFDLPFTEIPKLLHSKIHEERAIALFILVEQFKKADEKMKKKIVDFYLSSTRWINNWDLVDLSSHKILGEYLVDKDAKILLKMAKSKNLWERRIAIVSAFAFIRRGKLKESFHLAEMLLKDSHDLMHKAVGWMLREAGKKDRVPLEVFLDTHAHHMPRTMLRYAIEKFSPAERQFYLSRKNFACGTAFAQQKKKSGMSRG